MNCEDQIEERIFNLKINFDEEMDNLLLELQDLKQSRKPEKESTRDDYCASDIPADKKDVFSTIELVLGIFSQLLANYF